MFGWKKKDSLAEEYKSISKITIDLDTRLSLLTNKVNSLEGDIYDLRSKINRRLGTIGKSEENKTAQEEISQNPKVLNTFNPFI